MRHGTRPEKPDHRDYGFHQTFGSANFNTGILPENLCVDAGLWVPNQDIPNYLFTPSVPALLYGCTDYTQVDLCADEDLKLYSPLLLEDVTHANADGGADIKVALDAAKSVFGRTAYFNVQATGALDWFDAMRVAIWVTQNERRSISIGTPWFNEWHLPVAGIIPTAFAYDGVAAHYPWHNWKIAGWKTINGVPYLMGKSWQGPEYGDLGWAYFSRATINAVMQIRGTAAYTLTKSAPAEVQRIDMTVINTLVSFIRHLFGL